MSEHNAKILSDWNVWSDPVTKKGYIIYNAYVSYYGDPNTAQYVEEFTDDYLSIVPHSRPAVIGQDWCTKFPEPPPVGKPEWFGRGCEAPLLFSRKAANGDYLYYALFGHYCFCCQEGSELVVWIASDPLGSYTMQGDINLKGKGTNAERVVAGQSTGVLPLSTSNGTQFLWMSDRWQSTELWSSDLQYWGLLEFGPDGRINPIQWQDQFSIDLVLAPVDGSSATDVVV